MGLVKVQRTSVGVEVTVVVGGTPGAPSEPAAATEPNATTVWKPIRSTELLGSFASV